MCAMQHMPTLPALSTFSQSSFLALAFAFAPILGLAGLSATVHAQPQHSRLAAQTTAQAVGGFRIVVPPHCFEPMPHAADELALIEHLAHKRMLCREATGSGTPRQVLLTSAGLQVRNDLPNAWHRAGQ